MLLKWELVDLKCCNNLLFGEPGTEMLTGLMSCFLLYLVIKSRIIFQSKWRLLDIPEQWPGQWSVGSLWSPGPCICQRQLELHHSILSKHYWITSQWLNHQSLTVSIPHITTKSSRAIDLGKLVASRSLSASSWITLGYSRQKEFLNHHDVILMQMLFEPCYVICCVLTDLTNFGRSELFLSI